MKTADRTSLSHSNNFILSWLRSTNVLLQRDLHTNITYACHVPQNVLLTRQILHCVRCIICNNTKRTQNRKYSVSCLLEHQFFHYSPPSPLFLSFSSILFLFPFVTYKRSVFFEVGNRKWDRNMEKKKTIGTGYGLNTPGEVARLSTATSYSSLVQNNKRVSNTPGVPSPQGYSEWVLKLLIHLYLGPRLRIFWTKHQWSSTHSIHSSSLTL